MMLHHTAPHPHHTTCHQTTQHTQHAQHTRELGLWGTGTVEICVHGTDHKIFPLSFSLLTALHFSLLFPSLCSLPLSFSSYDFRGRRGRSLLTLLYSVSLSTAYSLPHCVQVTELHCLSGRVPSCTSNSLSSTHCPMK
jgi:hypothetical protein